MRSFFKMHPTTSEQFTSSLYDDTNFYEAFVKDLSRASAMIIIESPYLTVKRAQFFSKVFASLNNRGVTLRINTREPSHHDTNLEDQAWRAVKILKDCGVRVFLCSDMRHRKLAIIDGLILWEGSLNILSQSDSTEIMRRTVSSEMCEQMAQFTKINTIQR